MADPAVVDMGKLAAEEFARKALPPAFSSAVSGIKGPTVDEEAQMREMFAGQTLENFGDAVTVPAPQGQPVQAPIAPKAEVPAKFLKPDGTVDEEKLKTSSENLGKAIEQKQKTIDEMLAEYKEQEKQFTELGQKTKQLKETSNPAPVQEPAPQIPTIINSGLPQDQIRAQLLVLQQNDPIAFAVEISRAVSQREAREIAAPALQAAAVLAEQQRDSHMRQDLLNLAEKDSRVQDPAFFAELINEVKSDPAYMRLKNPLKSAWNEVKDRLRLGELNSSAQPSNASPVLGRGVPPSVSSLPAPMSDQSMRNNAQSLNPFSDDGKKLEEELRRLAESAWR